MKHTASRAVARAAAATSTCTRWCVLSGPKSLLANSSSDSSSEQLERTARATSWSEQLERTAGANSWSE